MGYLQETLLTSEKVVYKERQHWVVFVPGLFWLLVALLFAFRVVNLAFLSAFIGLPVGFYINIIVIIYAIYQLGVGYISYTYSEYAITDRRVLMSTGWFYRRSLELFMDKIEAVSMRQTLISRVLGYGTIIIIGTGGSRDAFIYINQPMKFRRKVQQYMDAYKQR